MSLPIVMNKSGRVPTSPQALRNRIDAEVSAVNPGYTSTLPGGLVEDMLSTSIGSVSVMDSAVTELVASVTPRGANPYILTQLGAIYGITQGGPFNTSVFLVFSSSNIGFVIQPGFTVSDGTHQYVVQTGGIVESGGDTDLLYALASTSGTWAVPDNTVTQLVTSVPTGYTLTVTNPADGIPGSATGESIESYRARVLQAGRSPSQQMASYLRTLLDEVDGVQSRLIAILQDGNNWKIIVGGGDPYAVGYAIWTALGPGIIWLTGASEGGTTVTVGIDNYPDTYSIEYVTPVQQDVSIALVWDTISPNLVSDAAMSNLGAPALTDYINSIVAGQPINLYQIYSVFQDAVASVVPTALLTTIAVEVTIDGVQTDPEPGTGQILGDPEGFFFTQIPAIFISRVT